MYFYSEQRLLLLLHLRVFSLSFHLHEGNEDNIARQTFLLGHTYKYSVSVQSLSKGLYV